MDNKKKKRNKQKSNQNPNTGKNTEVLNTEAEGKKAGSNTNKPNTDNTLEKKKEDSGKNSASTAKTVQKTVQKDIEKKSENKNRKEQPESEKPVAQKTAAPQKNEKEADSKPKTENKNLKEHVPTESVKKETKHESSNGSTNGSNRKEANASSEQISGTVVNAAKILLPVAACAIIIAVIISFVSSQKKSQAVTLNADGHSDVTNLAPLGDEPLAENAYANVNELMQSFCTALADGDMDTVRALKDYNTDREIITYEKKSEFIERYDNVKCYTKPGMEDNSYFVYVTYDVKFKDIETEAPGLNAFYVYTSEDGSLKIDGDREENIEAAFKLVTNQDDVVDLYNAINVDYTKATASDEALSQFMDELPVTIKESVGVALAQLETQQDESGDATQTETGETQPAETQTPDANEELPQNQAVNQIVRTTDTVNVRSSDSEEADKIGKAQAGTELKRVEERANGWSKVIFEDKQAYIKSDYLEVVTTEDTPAQIIGTITANTNVNVRSQASQESDRIGSAQAGTSYNLLEDQGEWYKIDFNGTTGFVKAEFFTR